MKIKVTNTSNETVLQYLGKQHIKLSAPCGGKGTCGKCKVRVLSDTAEISTEDRVFFSDKELEEGYRLSCKLMMQEGMQVEVEIERDKEFRIVSSYEQIKNEEIVQSKEGYGIAIDIGTTTIAMELIDLYSGKIKSAHTTLNSQRQYGADVITRINFSASGGVEKLKSAVQEDILKGIERLCIEANISEKLINEVTVAGNTTMLHTLVGLNCESLGQYPFTPVILDTTEYAFREIFEQSDLTAHLTLLPGISTYVGADITSGLYHCNIHESKGVRLFIDIGTNGEMAIGNKDKVIALATAAGPAFEGGNISCGVGSTKGAICSVRYENGEFICETIGEVTPVGICGSGLIDIMAECLKYELVDETGYIVDESDEIIIYQENEIKIVLTQKDIRQIQLAKAAIRAGVEALIHTYGLDYNAIEGVYLAGGFGKYITKESMAILGLIPTELKGKIIKIGNSSLGGCVKYLTLKDSSKNLGKVRSISEAINLAESVQFNELFVQHMMF
ncbi:MAG: ASKHA domain-containing protein [Cellulosilyticaceae bacterium]